MRVIGMRFRAPAITLALAAALLPSLAVAKGMVAPIYHPPPSCTDDNCKADDPRNDLPCQGLLCSFSSAKSMQPPVTAPRPEAMVQSKPAALALTAPVPAPAASSAKSQRKHAKPAQSKTIKDDHVTAPGQADSAAK